MGGEKPTGYDSNDDEDESAREKTGSSLQSSDESHDLIRPRMSILQAKDYAQYLGL